jgi:hypothetical protein
MVEQSSSPLDERVSRFVNGYEGKDTMSLLSFDIDIGASGKEVSVLHEFS